MNVFDYSHWGPAMPIPVNGKTYFSAQETATAAGISKPTLLRWIKARQYLIYTSGYGLNTRAVVYFSLNWEATAYTTSIKARRSGAHKVNDRIAGHNFHIRVNHC